MSADKAAIEAFLATRGATKCPPTSSHEENAHLWEMRREHEAPDLNDHNFLREMGWVKEAHEG